MLRDAALLRFHASRWRRAGCLFHLGIILVFQSQWDRRAIGEACSISSPFLFSWANRADEVAQNDFSALARLWSIPAGGGEGAGEAFPRALAMPVTHTLGPLQPKPPQFCSRKRSAVHVPMQRIAFAIAARCVCSCSAVRFLSYRGSGHQAAHSVPVPMLRHHSSVCTVMNWAPGFGRAWHGAKDFQQTYRKILQKAVLWQKKWAGWLDLSQNLDKFAMIIAKKTKA